MKEQTTGKEAVKNMEHLVKMLHKEWEQSGMPKAEVAISLYDVPDITKRIVDLIEEKQEQFVGEEMAFKQGMEFSKENFILLRLAKKIRKEKEKTVEKKTGTAFIVKMDREEYKLFISMMKMQEK